MYQRVPADGHHIRRRIGVWPMAVEIRERQFVINIEDAHNHPRNRMCQDQLTSSRELTFVPGVINNSRADMWQLCCATLHVCDAPDHDLAPSVQDFGTEFAERGFHPCSELWFNCFACRDNPSK